MSDQEINFNNKFKGILLDLEGVLYEENGFSIFVGSKHLTD